jgi:hypothetical protein
MNKLFKFVIDSGVLYVLSGLLITTGIISMIAYLTWIAFPAAFWPERPPPPQSNLPITTAWCLAGGVAAGVFALIQLQSTKPIATDSDYSKKMFGRSLVGIGFVLLLDALVNVVAIAGFAYSGSIPYLFQGPAIQATNTPSLVMNTNVPSTPQPSSTSNVNALPTLSTPRPPDVKTSDSISRKQATIETRPAILAPYQEDLKSAIQLLLALGFTIMGALFFFAKSLWEKMKADPIVPFDERIFWAGLWFRLGSAVVFTVVIFLALLYKGYAQALNIMPFVALLVGLSVKGAENLIAGITTRIFDAINGLVSK